MSVGAVPVGAASAASSTPTTLSLVSSPSSPQRANASLLFEVLVTPTTAIGTVALYDGSTLLGSGSHYERLWSYSTSSLAVGNHTLKATFTPDTPATYGASTTTMLYVIIGSGTSPTPTPTPTPTPKPTATPTPTPTRSSSSCTMSALDVPSCGVLWGAYKPPGSGETLATTVTDLESQVGRSFNIVYRYHDFSGVGGSGAFPDTFEKQLSASVHILLEDWAPTVFSTHTQLMWANVAAGAYDSTVIDPEAARIKAFGKPVMLTFDAEMDGAIGVNGQAANYVAAYRHIHDQFAAMGVTNVIWVWTITGTGGHDSEFASLYPGNSYVDWIGYDPYNFASCHNTAWRSFAQTIDQPYQWLEANGFGDKPFILAEYGTVPDPSSSSAAATWYSQIPTALAGYPNIKALLAWDDQATCDTRLTSSPGELAAFAAAGHAASLAVGGP
jgi:hypothetical protein